MAISDRKLKSWYRRLNRRLFGDVLPANTEVWWEHCDAIADTRCDHCNTHHDAESDTWMIRINPAIAWSPRQAEFALIHEMVHIEDRTVNGHSVRHSIHGAWFHMRMVDLALSGAFKELW